MPTYGLCAHTSVQLAFAHPSHQAGASHESMHAIHVLSKYVDRCPPGLSSPLPPLLLTLWLRAVVLLTLFSGTKGTINSSSALGVPRTAVDMVRSRLILSPRHQHTNRHCGSICKRFHKGPLSITTDQLRLKPERPHMRCGRGRRWQERVPSSSAHYSPRGECS